MGEDTCSHGPLPSFESTSFSLHKKRDRETNKIISLCVKCVPLVTNTSLLKLNLRDNWMEGMGGAAMLKENCYITGGALPTSAPRPQGAQGGGSATHTHLCATLTPCHPGCASTPRRLTWGRTDWGSMVPGPFPLCSWRTPLWSHLSRNELPDRDTQHLAQALTSNTKLETLDLSHNTMGDVAGRANIFLGTLDLSYNGLGKDGAVALGQALRENPLEDINISNNRVPPEGAIRFAMGLQVNKTIKTLNVSHRKENGCSLEISRGHM
ncbi:unnamed protein product [Coregonus sp. 'balchen']|nr:unnamed protein product [Coregonus sp. 'balchen']